MQLIDAITVSYRIDPVWLAERELVRDRWDADEHAMAVYQGATHAVAVTNESGTALVCGGLMGSGPGVLHTFMFGAVGWEQVMGEAVRYGRQMIRQALDVDGIHRVQCVSLCQHEKGRRFLELMGLVYEHELRGWGKGGESFFMFARTRES